jgi:hypothetical protein
MTTPTVPVTVDLAAMGGPALPGITIRATLDDNEVYAGIVVAKQVTAVTNSSGVAVLNLFPNAPAPAGLGTRGTTYRFSAITGGRALNFDARVPNAACRLENIIVNDEAVPLDAAQVALGQAQSAAASASGSALAAAAAATSAIAGHVADPDPHAQYAKDTDLAGLVPATRTVNGKPLTGNVTLAPADIGSPSGSGSSIGTNTGDQFVNTPPARLIGRGASGIGPAQEITLGAGLTMTGNELSAAGGGSSGDVTGPAAAAPTNIAVFSGPSGKVLADGGLPVASLVPVTRTVNGKPLSGNVTLNAGDVGAPSGSGSSSGTNTGDQFTATAASKLLGRGAAGGAGAAQEITLGTGLTLTGTTLSAPGGMDPDTLTDAGALTGAERIGLKQSGNARRIVVDTIKDYLLNGGKDAAFNLANAISASFGTKYGYTASIGVGGGTVTQANSKTQAVTLDCAAGQITLNAASLAAGAQVAFTLNNSYITAHDEVYVWKKTGGTPGAYLVQVDSVAAGSCTILVKNTTSGVLSEAPVLGFSVKSAAITPVVGNGGSVSGPTMLLGMGLGIPTYYSGAIPFANLMLMGSWNQNVGTRGSIVYNQGTISGALSSDEHQMILVRGDYLTAGVEYTLQNPQGANMGLGTLTSGAFGSYSTSPTITFTWPGGDASTYLVVYVKGNLSDTLGAPKVARTDLLPQLAAGNIWDPDFLNFYTVIAPKIMRTMDWTRASFNAETDFTDRTLPNKPNIDNKVNISPTVPYEYLIDLANRTGRDIWVCIPPRATTAYITAMANLFNNGTGAVGSIGNTGLGAGRLVYFEGVGNEVWNNAPDYYANTSWTETSLHTRYTATISGSTFHKVAHGLANGDPLRGWNTPVNRRNLVVDGGADPGWFNISLGVAGNQSPTNGAYAKVLGVDDFEVYLDSALTVKITPPTGAATWVYSKELELTPAIDANYGKLAKRNFDIITPILTTARYKRVISGQATVADRVVPRILGAGGAVDYYAIAPYFDSEFFMLALDHLPGGTSVSPKFFCNRTGTYKTNIFPSGTVQPTEDALENHTGAGLISGHDTTYVKKNQDVSPPSAPETGLTAGTPYTGFLSYRNTQNMDARNLFLHTMKFDFTPAANKSGTSTTSYNTTIVAGVPAGGLTPTFTTQAGKAFAAGQTVHIFRTSDPTAYITGRVTAYNSTTGALTIDMSVPSFGYSYQYGTTQGTFTDWSICTREFYFDTLANQEWRNRINIDNDGILTVKATLAQIAASANPAVQLVCYEGGDHMSGHGEPFELASWIFSTYLPSTNYGNAMKYNLHSIADAGAKAHCWYADNMGNVWSITNRYTNVTDPRVLAFASFAGVVPVQTAVDIPDFNAPDVGSAPGAYPYTVYTFPDATLTYSIKAGDPKAQFAMSGPALQLLSGTGINFATPTLRDLYVNATDGSTGDTPKVSFFLGAGWFQSDAAYAKKMSTQVGTASIPADVGGTLTLTGSGATLASNLLVCGGSASYASSTGLNATQDFTKPCMIAFLGNSNSVGYTGQWLLWVGSGGRWVRASPDTGALLWEIFDGTTTTQISCAWDTTNKSNWLHHDGAGNYTVGRDATTVNTGTQTPPSGPSATISQSVSIGSTSAKLGTIEMLWRTGLTVAQTKTIAQALPA